MRMHECGEGRGHHGRMGRKMAHVMEGMMAMRGRGRGGSRDWGGGWDDDWGGRGGPGGPGRHRRGRMFAGGELRLVLLRLVADESRHGYELIKAIEELTGGAYAPSPGVVYPTLSLLVDEGKIAEADGDGPRKAFTATDDGRAELAERREEADALIARLQAVAEKGERGASPPVRRAIGNLFTALRHRFTAGFEGETAHLVAEILDEAARKIERL